MNMFKKNGRRGESNALISIRVGFREYTIIKKEIRLEDKELIHN